MLTCYDIVARDTYGRFEKANDLVLSSRSSDQVDVQFKGVEIHEMERVITYSKIKSS